MLSESTDQQVTSCKNEIRILDLFIILLRQKWTILTITIFGGVVLSLLSFMFLQKQEGFLECRIAAVDTPLGVLAETTKNPHFVYSLIENTEIRKLLYRHAWDPQKGAWIGGRQPDPSEAADLLHSRISAQIVNSTVKISFYDPRTETSQAVLSLFLEQLSRYLMSENRKALAAIIEKKKLLEQEFVGTANPDIRKVLASEIADSVRKEIEFRVVRKPFSLLSPPSRHQEFLSESYRGFSYIYAVLYLFMSFLFGIFLAFTVEYFKKEKADNPAKIEQIKILAGLKKKTGN